MTKPEWEQEETPEEEEPKTENPAARFLIVARHRPHHRFPFLCQGCGETLPINQRVVLNQRKCPGCGRPITVAEIDQQSIALEKALRSGCLPQLALLLVVAACALLLPSLL